MTASRISKLQCYDSRYNCFSVVSIPDQQCSHVVQPHDNDGTLELGAIERWSGRLGEGKKKGRIP